MLDLVLSEHIGHFWARVYLFVSKIGGGAEKD
jgi:hypothetical protein